MDDQFSARSVGFISPVGEVDAFVIPVFRSQRSDMNIVQTHIDDTVIGFTDDDISGVTVVENVFVCTHVGGDAIYAFREASGFLSLGSRSELTPYFIDLLNAGRFDHRPMTRFQVSRFCRLRDRIQQDAADAFKAIACQSRWAAHNWRVRAIIEPEIVRDLDRSLRGMTLSFSDRCIVLSGIDVRTGGDDGPDITFRLPPYLYNDQAILEAIQRTTIKLEELNGWWVKLGESFSVSGRKAKPIEVVVDVDLAASVLGHEHAAASEGGRGQPTPRPTRQGGNRRGGGRHAVSSVMRSPPPDVVKDDDKQTTDASDHSSAENLSSEEKPRSMLRMYELVELIKAYDPSVDEDALNRAYVFAMKAHGRQYRTSDTGYFFHSLEVAGILSVLKLDTATIVTALLHDTVEDTVATLDDIEKLFGKEIARLVDGVTKLSRLELHSEQAKQAENLRMLVLAMSEDIRVLLVKLADRLHNMRTLFHLKNPDERKRIARETIEIYSPLAERIGIYKIKEELDDLAFAALNPDARDGILAQLARLRSEGESRVQSIIAELREVLRDEGLLDVSVSGREKTAYSIWRKCQLKNVSFEQLSDIIAFRITVGTPAECDQALGIIHAHYPAVPGQFKDYISTPKPNGYRSLHTRVIGPGRNRIEVQIRTHDMHEIAELGVAAHWAYTRTTDAREHDWLHEMLDILEHAQKSEEFLEHTKLDLFRDQVFCFTPKGDLIVLPRGATPVDFAYAVHSAVGDHCVGAKINGRMLPLRTQLQNGDQVDIVTSKAQTPVPGWERFVVTGKARARIRKFLRTQQRAQYIELGCGMLRRQFKENNMLYDENFIMKMSWHFKRSSIDNLFECIGNGKISLKSVYEFIIGIETENGSRV